MPPRGKRWRRSGPDAEAAGHDAQAVAPAVAGVSALEEASGVEVAFPTCRPTEAVELLPGFVHLRGAIPPATQQAPDRNV